VVYKINAYSSAKVVGYTTDINEDVVLPNEIYYNSEMCTIDTISEYAFFNCGNLKSISIPNSIKYIGNNAFSGTDLTSLNIEDGDEPIFLDSNYYPYNEEQVRINGSPYRVSICGFEGTLVFERYYHGLFYDCQSLRDIKIGRSLDYPHYRAVMSGYQYDEKHDSPFFGCKNLSDVIIGEKVRNLGSNDTIQCFFL